MPYIYQVFGLTLASVIELPELMPASASPDVRIIYGQVPLTLENATVETEMYQIRGDQWLLHLENDAGIRVLVHQGRTITIEQVDFRHPDIVRLYLLGWCMGAMLTQRHHITLHGNAVVTPQGAIVIAGDSGAGKSSLTAEFYKRGYPILTDDVCAVRWQPDQAPLIQPGIPRLKLWAEVLDHFQEDVRLFKPVHPTSAKYHYSVKDAYSRTGQPFLALYVLNPTTTPNIRFRAIEGVKKVEQVSQQLYKLQVRHGQRNWPGFFQSLAALARQIRVCQIERPLDNIVCSQMADLIEADLVNS
ncbi:MAG: hypothetical protein AAF629_19195 [Chloroflexota bacterium]